MTLTRRIDTPGGAATLSLCGRLDALEAGTLRAAVEQLVTEEYRSLTIDLAEVHFMDSAGLAAVLQAHRALQFAGGELTVVRPAAENANRVIRLTQFDKILTMRDAVVER